MNVVTKTKKLCRFLTFIMKCRETMWIVKIRSDRCPGRGNRKGETYCRFYVWENKCERSNAPICRLCNCPFKDADSFIKFSSLKRNGHKISSLIGDLNGFRSSSSIITTTVDLVKLQSFIMKNGWMLKEFSDNLDILRIEEHNLEIFIPHSNDLFNYDSITNTVIETIASFSKKSVSLILDEINNV